MEELTTREIVAAGDAGFPTPVYFGMIDFMKKKGYFVKKVTDWLEISPRSAFYQDMMTKKSNIEQSLGRILPAVSDVRRDMELIKHDLRKLENVMSHFETKDVSILKSDFVDLVDAHSPISMISLANSGRFPTIIVDFYKCRSASDVENLKISQGEKQIIRNKWQLFTEWKIRYGKDITGKVAMLREQLRSREASLKNYKETLKPYVKALHRVKVSESSYSGMDDPSLIEGYQTSVAGVDLIMWKGISLDKQHIYRDDEKYDYYTVFEVQVRRATLIQRDKEGEGMRVFITAKLLTASEMAEKETEIKMQDELIERQLEEFMGSREIEKAKPAQPAQKSAISEFLSVFNYKRKLSESSLKGMKRIIVNEELRGLEIRIKELIGGLVLKNEQDI